MGRVKGLLILLAVSIAVGAFAATPGSVHGKKPKKFKTPDRCKVGGKWVGCR